VSPRSELDIGRVVTGGGGVLLLVSLFFDWYDVGISGWTAFETWDVLLAVIALAAVFDVVPAARVRTRLMVVPRPAVAVAALALVALQMVNPPPAATAFAPASGAWLALAATLIMAAGAVLATASVSVTLNREGAAPAGEDDAAAGRAGSP
jgi:hypothetical protein